VTVKFDIWPLAWADGVGVWEQGTVRKRGTGGWRKLHKELYDVNVYI